MAAPLPAVQDVSRVAAALVGPEALRGEVIGPVSHRDAADAAAAHAAMAGRTAMVVGRWHGRFVHLPISLATGSRHLYNTLGADFVSKPQSVFTYDFSLRFGGYYANHK